MNQSRKTKKNVLHGLSYSPEYQIWRQMLARCHRPGCVGYENYGGRGISVCERWREFVNFYNDMGPRPSRDYSIDRIDNDGDYQPGNCRWATRSVQQRNKRRTLTSRRFRIVEWNGEALSLAEWARRLNISYGAICYRFRQEWPLQRALSPEKNTFCDPRTFTDYKSTTQ
jgi:hypothetical protein